MARGPAYPFVNLRTAVSQLEKLYAYAKRSPALVDSLAKEAWGWSPTSSTTKKVAAALKYFGVAEDVGKDGNSLRITDRGYRILVDSHDSPERMKALREAALAPTQYAYCYKEWGAEVPQSARSTLIFNRGFVATTVDAFLKDYKATMEYAGLSGGNTSSPQEAVEDAAQEEAISDGKAAERPAPAGLALQSTSSATPFPGRVAHEGIAMRQDVFSVDEGSVVLQWPVTLSKDSLKDIEDWLEIVKRKLARSLKESPSQREGES